ncbi:MAG: hypothetical protein DI565_01375 [Ancylobacter novellus]|uniref:Uncharacterized protein n=1 Tax=Ancylobacter novellus TaxID=921 RepID=A0A2W5MZ94_ANCNO|nr:MAG: hypothetical protein DI565_01375 [Ancylobacter novellus]
MVNPANREAIDTLAAELFSRDHPDRAWSAIIDHRNRLGVASAQEQAVYRGFATARLAADARTPDPAIAAAALAAEARVKGKLGAA